jgi:hypothetical protein
VTTKKQIEDLEALLAGVSTSNCGCNDNTTPNEQKVRIFEINEKNINRLLIAVGEGQLGFSADGKLLTKTETPSVTNIFDSTANIFKLTGIEGSGVVNNVLIGTDDDGNITTITQTRTDDTTALVPKNCCDCIDCNCKVYEDNKSSETTSSTIDISAVNITIKLIENEDGTKTISIIGYRMVEPNDDGRVYARQRQYGEEVGEWVEITSDNIKFTPDPSLNLNVDNINDAVNVALNQVKMRTRSGFFTLDVDNQVNRINAFVDRFGSYPNDGDMMFVRTTSSEGLNKYAWDHIRTYWQKLGVDSDVIDDLNRRTRSGFFNAYSPFSPIQATLEFIDRFGYSPIDGDLIFNKDEDNAKYAFDGYLNQWVNISMGGVVNFVLHPATTTNLGGVISEAQDDNLNGTVWVNSVGRAFVNGMPVDITGGNRVKDQWTIDRSEVVLTEVPSISF